MTDFSCDFSKYFTEKTYKARGKPILIWFSEVIHRQEFNKCEAEIISVYAKITVNFVEERS